MSLISKEQDKSNMLVNEDCMSLASRDQDQSQANSSMYTQPPLVPQISISSKPKGGSLYDQMKNQQDSFSQ